MLYQWASENGFQGQVVTVDEVRTGDATKGTGALGRLCHTRPLLFRSELLSRADTVA